MAPPKDFPLVTTTKQILAGRKAGSTRMGQSFVKRLGKA